MNDNTENFTKINKIMENLQNKIYNIPITDFNLDILLKENMLDNIMQKYVNDILDKFKNDSDILSPKNNKKLDDETNILIGLYNIIKLNNNVKPLDHFIDQYINKKIIDHDLRNTMTQIKKQILDKLK